MAADKEGSIRIFRAAEGLQRRITLKCHLFLGGIRTILRGVSLEQLSAVNREKNLACHHPKGFHLNHES